MLLRLQDNDTFGDDDYLDRTLEKKNVIIKENALEMVTTEDYWQL